MKVECPNCSHEWNEELHATICSQRVAITQSSKIKEIFRHINKDTERGRFAKKVFDIIESLKGEELSVKQISRLLGVFQYTDGDLIRTILDYNVCQGK
jgi:uncharacterized membrane protein